MRTRNEQSMKRSIRMVCMLVAALSLGACYNDYVHDYEEPNMGFALTNPLRTVIAERDMTIYVGVSIGGKREVDMSDWARFVIDESLVEGNGLELLPANYYELSDPNTFRVRKSNLAVADVGITFTDAFYNDPLSLTTHYVLPFRMTENSIGAIRAGADSSLVAIKYISNYAGTYYLLGEVTEVDAAGTAIGETVNYQNKDLINNQTCTFTSEGPRTVVRPGVGNSVAAASGSVRLTVNSAADASTYDVTMEGVNCTLTSATGKYVKEGEYTFNSGDVKAPQFNLEYTYEKEGRYYKVSEKLVLRQDPLYDLRVETW